MNKYEKDVQQLLHASGAQLVRNRRHKVFRLEDGQNFVMASTPSTQGSSRQSLATLRRLLSQPAVLDQQSAPFASLPEPLQRKRMIVPNNPPREQQDGPNIYAGTRTVTVRPETRKEQFRARSVVEVLMAADKSEEFWYLDPCGRIRVLARLTEQFAKVTILPVQFIKASVEEIDRHFGLDDPAWNPADKNIAEIVRRQGSLSMRTLSESGGFRGVPSMLVDDPVFGELLIDASAWSILEDTNYLFVSYGRQLEGTSYGIASQVWDSADPTRPASFGLPPDHYIYTTFITTGMMKRKDFRLQTCANWTNPGLTRPALQQILALMQNMATTE